jgi:hypothetical protein
MQSHYCNWRKTERVSEWVVLKIGGQDWSVLFVTWDPSILHQTDNNLEAISEPDQLTNTCAGCLVRKRNAWLVNNAWDSNHTFCVARQQGFNCTSDSYSCITCTVIINCILLCVCVCVCVRACAQHLLCLWTQWNGHCFPCSWLYHCFNTLQ